MVTPARGFTLVELLLVLAILIGLAAALLVRTSSIQSSAEIDTTRASLDALLQAVSRYRHDSLESPTSVAELLVKPATVADFDVSSALGWRGPYVVRMRTGSYPDLSAPGDDHAARGFVTVYGAAGEPTVLDAWEEPIVIQIPDRDASGAPYSDEELRHVRLVSAGPDRILETPRTDAAASAPGNALLPRRADCGDDLVLYVHVADLRPD